jgi:hypothetical protein
MHFEHILINLKRDLIRTFAVTDEWFDKGHTLRSYRPSTGGWNVNEVLEHVMLTNHFLLILIEKGCTKALKKVDDLSGNVVAPKGYTLDNAALQEISKPGTFVWQRPEHHQPTGQKSMHEVRRELRNHLDRCLITLDLVPNGEGTLHQTTMSVNNLGKLDVYQFIYFLSLHMQRHLQQMRRIEEEFNSSSVAFDLEAQ